jgi:hypothetical protein
MNPIIKRVIFWSPRALCILLIVFLSIFALDVFGEGYNIGETILALFTHLIPTYLIVIVLVIAWRWEMIGTLLFFALASSLLYMNFGGGWTVSGPLIFIGALFLLNWLFRKQLKERSDA